MTRQWKWIIWIIGIIMLLLASSLAAMNVAVEYVLDSMQSVQAPAIDEPKLILPKRVESIEKESITPAPANKENPSDPINNPQETNQESSKPTRSKDIIEGDSNKNQSANGKKEFSYSADISPYKADKIQEKITLEEKTEVLQTVIANFSQADLQYFARLAQGGISVEEKKEAKKLFLAKLTEEEYNQLINIAAKYGLSQGRHYNETKKDYEGK